MRAIKIGVIGIFLFLISGLNAFGAHDYLVFDKPMDKKVPIAIPLFKTVSDQPNADQTSREAADLLSQTLEFTGFFQVLDRKAYLVDVNSPDYSTSRINYANWTVIGAEYLITGMMIVKKDIVEIELRLFDPYKAKQILGKRYKGWPSDVRVMIRRFCNEVIFKLSGKYGIFNSQIAFVNARNKTKNIYIADFDGYNPQPFTKDKSINMSPAWSSDGKWLAFTSFKRGHPDLYIEHRNQKKGYVVSKKGINITPAWVPGKFEMAATLSFTGDQEIYMLTGTGKIIKRVTRKWGIDVCPAWSPDGKKMAFVSNRSGTPQIYIRDMDSSQVSRLTFEGRYNTSPAWSPKGDKIAFAGVDNGHFNIYIIGADGKGLSQLTHNSGNNETPTWSPDGNLIAFSSTREGASRIYVMTAFGTDQRRLLTMEGEQSSPSWSPRLFN